MHEAFNLNATILFDLKPEEYHTNIVLAVLAGKVCVIYKDAFEDPEIAEMIQGLYLNRTASLTEEEKNGFVANCIAATDRDILMSQTALDSLSGNTRYVLERNGFAIHGIQIDELEKGGGSLRCLIAEIF